MFDHTPIWSPSTQRIEQSLLSRFMCSLNQSTPFEFHDYPHLHRWSVEHSELFWSHLWQFCQVNGEMGERVTQMGPARFSSPVAPRDQIWFADAQLNYAENLLEAAMRNPHEIYLRFLNEQEQKTTLTGRELCEQVSIIQQWLIAHDIGEGDVVAGYLPYLPHSVIAMLATTSLGAVWTSVSPDFGIESVVERFEQTAPKALFCCNGYQFGGKTHDMSAKNNAVVSRLPSLRAIGEIHCCDGISPSMPSEISAMAITWQDWQQILASHKPTELRFRWIGFNAPLFILYSSGTTGVPKCIVHSAGGTLLNHLKEHQLHCDIQPGDRVFYYTTCGWMMWNWHVSTLASGACLVIYDGSPTYPNFDRLWALAEEEQISLFGTAAKYLEALAHHHYFPNQVFGLKHLKTLCSTGSVLYPEQFDFVYQHIKSDLHLASISGGTDICGCFVLGNPISPVYRGECQYAGLGVDAAVFNAKGKALETKRGELVCRNSLPNFPLGFWRDDGERYHHAYWHAYPNVWHHGDDVAKSPQGGWVFFGRSDATLNPGGVRIGTAEIYRQLGQFDEIEEAIAVGKQVARNEEIWLLLKLREDALLNDKLKQKITTTLRTQCSPRHVPKVIVAVPDIPKTRSGKLVELAVKNILNQHPVKNVAAIANPEALDAIAQLCVPTDRFNRDE